MSRNAVRIIDVAAENIDQTGFFCFMSKRKSEGYRCKREWLLARFNEGLRIKLLELPERGFIEYLPGEYAWRAVNAAGYFFIHCLWVVGKSKGKGLGGRLLETCLQDAEAAGVQGAAMVTSERVWLADDRLLHQCGFECADEAPPFRLMVKKFHQAPSPSFTGEYERKAQRFGDGLTVVYADQCPYIPDALATVAEYAAQMGIPFQSVELDDSEQIRSTAPSPYGIFGIMYNGRLLSYHYMLPKDLAKAIESSQDAESSLR